MKQRAMNQMQSTRQTGVGIVTAIFLLVVLAGLGTALVTLFTSQQASSSLDELGSRAYQAARAGAEWALWQEAALDKCPTSPTTFALPANTSLSGFSVTVTCVQQDVTSGNHELSRYIISAVACNNPGAGGCPNPSNSPNYVQRKVEVEI
jgi:MSHA biogenesis protein MshP